MDSRRVFSHLFLKIHTLVLWCWIHIHQLSPGEILRTCHFFSYPTLIGPFKKIQEPSDNYHEVIF